MRITIESVPLSAFRRRKGPPGKKVSGLGIRWLNGHREWLLCRDAQVAVERRAKDLLHALADHFGMILVPRGEFASLVQLIHRAREGEISHDQFLEQLLAEASP